VKQVEFEREVFSLAKMLYNEIAIGTPEEWKYVMYS
jgi:hypothetical protein